MSSEDRTVLVVSPVGEDHESVRALLARSHWRVECARSYREAWLILHQRPVSAVITECVLPDGLCWKDLLEEAGEMEDAPPVIVSTRVGYARLYDEVLSAGGYDVLTKPLARAELLQVLSGAWRQAADRRVLAGRGARVAAQAGL
jgi:DNA-binding NtrC family response regulator